MPLVHKIDGIGVHIYGLDHPPPHVHFRSSNFKLKMNIADRRVVRLTGTIRPSEEQMLADWVTEMETRLMELWQLAFSGDVVPRC
ncbi:DUF4160 domain-containing protein [Plantibacter flavus]|uniref:DUF4160 domain-containing protein n=1 Tax=Plantibacter flavus TaxID=150123 RepID=UPI0013759BC3|nr:DUF4160 domain-containing protein [Plantibacter flavus]